MNRALCLLLLAACDPKPKPVQPVSELPPPGEPPAPEKPGAPMREPYTPANATKNALPRMELNRWAVRANVPLYWTVDGNGNGTLDPDEVASLLFYPDSGKQYVANGAFTDAFHRDYDLVVSASKATVPPVMNDDIKRMELVGRDLDQGRPTLVHNDFRKLSADLKKFVGHMMQVGVLIDQLYEEVNGAAALRAKLPPDSASHSLFRRNRGPKCVAPATENDPLCSAIPGAPKPVFGLYPAELQTQPKFCDALAKRPDATTLLSPFTVVRGAGDKLSAVPYTEAYRDLMTKISTELMAAASAIDKGGEAALVKYLQAAATAFKTNQWEPADEAWSKMTVDNSRWYVRAAPDEVYWEPCSQKAGPHLTFALINQGSRVWQQKLVPVQQEMEAAIAKRAGAPYKERKVTFHLPDFIDIVINSGDDRDPLGATIGQSLPNWGPVANEGRGRTVAMVNLYSDPDSVAARKAQAESMLTADSMKFYSTTGEPGLLNTILHEATHNFGPAHEYQVGGKTASQLFGGPLASTMEELKAQTGALFLLEFLRGKQLISDELAKQTYVDGIVWAMGHISQGMYDADKKPKNYSQLAAIQVGYLIEKKALIWDAKATAANGKDIGAFRIDMQKLVPVAAEMMKLTAGIKARGDKAAAELLVKKYVDGKVVPHATITERYLRFPKASFIYAVSM
jgi:hypothetical protein